MHDVSVDAHQAKRREQRVEKSSNYLHHNLVPRVSLLPAKIAFGGKKRDPGNEVVRTSPLHSEYKIRVANLFLSLSRNQRSLAQILSACASLYAHSLHKALFSLPCFFPPSPPWPPLYIFGLFECGRHVLQLLYEREKDCCEQVAILRVWPDTVMRSRPFSSTRVRRHRISACPSFFLYAFLKRSVFTENASKAPQPHYRFRSVFPAHTKTLENGTLQQSICACDKQRQIDDTAAK